MRRRGERLYEERATLIVEVLSPSTVAEDRRGKFRAYLTCRSLERYILVDPVFRRFEVYRNEQWQSCGPGGVVETGYGVIVIDEFYDELDQDAAT